MFPSKILNRKSKMRFLQTLAVSFLCPTRRIQRWDWVQMSKGKIVVMTCNYLRFYSSVWMNHQKLFCPKKRYGLVKIIGAPSPSVCWKQNIQTLRLDFDGKEFNQATSMLVTDVGRFCHQHPISFNISVGHQHPKDVTNIEILSLTSKNCHQDKVTNIHL